VARREQAVQVLEGSQAHKPAGGSPPRGIFLLGLCALAGGLQAATVWLTLDQWRGLSLPDRVASLAFVGIVLPVMGFGALIVMRRPGNRIGWLLVATGLAVGTSGLAQTYANAGPGQPGARLAAWVSNWLWVSLGLLVVLLLLVYPDGQLPSPRWRPLVWAAVVGYGLAAVCSALYPELPALPGSRNPTGLYGPAGQLVRVAFSVLNWLLLPVEVAALASLLVRFRRSSGVVRQQLKWLAYGAALTLLVWLVPLPGWLGRWQEAAGNVVAWALPAAIAVAVLRYRLYDIDRLINRTLVYGLLTALLGGAYAGAVLVLGQVFGGVGRDPPSWAVAGITLAVAALFQPARRRIQRAVDRRFNRRKYNAAQTIQGFSTRLRDQVDLDTLSSELLAVADQTMQPTQASLWLRPSPPGSSDMPSNEATPTTWAY
jgi:hypothetical protein